MSERADRIAVSIESTLRDVAKAMDEHGDGFAVVLDADGRIAGVVTDGDMRRAMLRGERLDTPARALLAHKGGDAAPVVARIGTPDEELRALMHERDIRQIPLVDEDGRYRDVAFAETLESTPRGGRAVIMAGGFGKRLAPLTQSTPKPMLNVGGRPILERTVQALRKSGFRDLSITTHYLAEAITGHFGDGGGFDVSIEYVHEENPNGTAGALALMPPPEEPLLVVNGDILTGLNFRAMFDFHAENKADLTVGVAEYKVSVPYGVVEHDDGRVTGLSEKPELSFRINAGVYVLSPAAFALIPKGRRFDMTDLIAALVTVGRPVVCFPIRELWLDIGKPEDFAQAQDLARTADARTGS